MADVGIFVRRDRLHGKFCDSPRQRKFPKLSPHLAFDILEAEVLPHESGLSYWLHGAGSLFDLGHRVVLPITHRPRGFDLDAWHLRGAHAVCLPDKVRLHVMDAISLWGTVGLNPVRLHGCILPV